MKGKGGGERRNEKDRVRNNTERIVFGICRGKRKKNRKNERVREIQSEKQERERDGYRKREGEKQLREKRNQERVRESERMRE